MADATANEAEQAQASGKKGLLIGLALALLGGSGAFFITSSGMLGGGASDAGDKPADTISADVAFLPLDPITVAVGDPADRRFLRFRAQIEVPSVYQADVEKLLPRVLDVMNTYLRSVTMTEVQNPAALLTLRAQLRRRLDLVVGGEKINDLLIMEFVVN